jgi:cation diffusion facilitator family transporter
MPAKISARRVVVVSFLVDVLDVISNLAVAWLTGSAVVFAEMAQGLADSIGSLLLVVGERRARRPADPEHPLGHGREAFFWGLLSALAMLVIGVGLSAWRGWRQWTEPEPLERPWLAVAVLVLAVVTNGYAVSLSVRKLRTERGSLRGAFEAAARPLVKNALLRDAVGTLSCGIGLAAVGLSSGAGWPALDGLGALVVAALFAVCALVLIHQANDLITGRSLPATDLDQIRAAVHRIPEVRALHDLAAVYAGPREVWVELDLELVDQLDTPGVEGVLDAIEASVRGALPETEAVRIDLNPLEESAHASRAPHARPVAAVDPGSGRRS